MKALPYSVSARLIGTRGERVKSAGILISGRTDERRVRKGDSAELSPMQGSSSYRRRPIMRFLARQGGTYPSTPFLLASVALSLVLCASLFQHEAVAGLGEGVAQRARDSYESVKQRIHLANSPSLGNDGYLEPEWMFAKDISIVYTVGRVRYLTCCDSGAS